MINLRMGCLSLLLLLVLPAAAEPLQVKVLITPKQRNAYHQVFRQFTAGTGIEINTGAFEDADYKRQLEGWLQQETPPDVLYWQASNRLYQYVEQDLIHPIGDLWQQQGWDRGFQHVKANVSYQGQAYALPLSYYHWGLFYNKPLIAEHGGEPRDWPAFLRLCDSLKQAGITPIGLDTQSLWPVGAWFDYLNLRLNGLAFHQQLLLGGISFNDPLVRRVFEHWKVLIDAGYFRLTNQGESWDVLFPYIYRSKLGMMLIGNFASVKLPTSAQNTMGFMPFPSIAPLPRFEDAPLDVLMIPKGSKQIAKAEKLLAFMAQAEIQAQLNDALGYLPPHRQAAVGDNPYIQAGAQLLQQAHGFAQFFDRDTLPEFEQNALPVLSRFAQQPDIDATLQALEALRQQYLVSAP